MSHLSELSKFLRKNKWKQEKRPVKKGGGLTMRPLKLLARKVVFEKKGMPLSTLEVTKGIIDDMRFAFNHKWNVTVIIVGGPGEGKSKAVFRLKKVWLEMTRSNFKYAWDIEKIPTDEVKDGGWVHLDEWLLAEGPGKIQALQRLKNLFDTGRAKQICISVSTPETPNVPFCTFELTTLAQDFEKRINLYEVRVPIPRHGLVYIGNALLPLTDDDEEWTTYEEDTYARKTELWQKRGQKTISSAIDPEQAAKEFIEWAEKNQFSIDTKTNVTTLLKKLAQEKGWVINYVSETDITNWVTLFRQESIINGGGRGYTGQITNLQEAVFTRLTELGVKPVHIEWAKQYLLENEKQTDIAKRFNVTQEAVSQATGEKSELRVVLLGVAFEDVWAARLKSEGKIVKQGGRNTPKPDILILNEQGDILEVQSLKCQATKATTTTINRSDLAVSELELMEQGKPLKLVYYDLIQDRVSIVDVDDRKRYTFIRE